MKFSFVNLGCKINQVEMEQASEGLVQLGYEYTTDPVESDFLLINTCTVTSKADRKSLQSIRKYSKSERLRHIFVTGCYSELETDLAAKIHPKNHIIAQRDKGKMPQIIDNLLCSDGKTIDAHIAVQDRFTAFKLARVSSGDLDNQQVNFFQHTRAFVKIQDGCNAFCSYCRIPFARGAPVSRSYVDIMEHLERLKKSGIREIVLSGINIGKYLDPATKTGFSKLLENMLDRAGDMRIKISSIEPFSLDEKFFSLVDHPNLAPHIHLPLQGLSDDILVRMNRRYLLKDYLNIVEKIYQVRDDFSIAADVIVGYPGETDEVYQTGKNFLQACGISKIHVFPFSARPFTDNFLESDLATGNNTVAEAVKKERSHDLRAFSRELERKFLKKLEGKIQNLILETHTENPWGQEQIRGTWYQGTTEYNLKGAVALPDSMLTEWNSNKKNREDNSQFPDENYNGRILGVKIANFSPLVFQSLQSLNPHQTAESF